MGNCFGLSDGVSFDFSSVFFHRLHTFHHAAAATAAADECETNEDPAKDEDDFEEDSSHKHRGNRDEISGVYI